MTSNRIPTPYLPTSPQGGPSSDELRARIPGWGVDLDPADRPSFPRERPQPEADAPWTMPEAQPELRPRERSVEHGMLPPVFGTAQPLSGLSGAIRRFSYARYSEGRMAHWLLLVLGDRVNVVEGVARSLVSGRPDLPGVGSGIRSELTHHGLSARLRSNRADKVHHLM